MEASADSPWTADSGTNYYVTVQSRDSRGRSVSRQERRVKWRPASGHVSTWFDDIVVTGTAPARFPLSVWKIAFVTLLVIIIVGLIAFTANR